MKLAVGQIEARCPGCGASDFNLRGAELEMHSELFCVACGKATPYQALLNEIGEQAMQQANEALAKLRKMRND